MNRPTHVEFGYEVAVILLVVFGLNVQVLGISFNVLVMLLSLGIGICLPDVDHLKSVYGRTLQSIRIACRMGGILLLVVFAGYYFVLGKFYWQLLVVTWLLLMFDFLSGRIKHRGIMHSVWVPLSLCVLIWFSHGGNWFGEQTYIVNSFLAGIAVGYVLHLIADMFSVDKVKLLQPLSQIAFGIGLVRSGKKSEKRFKGIIRIIFVSLLGVRLMYPLIQPLIQALM